MLLLLLRHVTTPFFASTHHVWWCADATWLFTMKVLATRLHQQQRHKDDIQQMRAEQRPREKSTA
jgi:hypothetical protein